MPAVNAPLAVQTLGPTPAGNPSNGKFVLMSPFSGPKGSPFDAMVYPPSVSASVPGAKVADPLNLSTGALSTGIGYGANPVIPQAPGLTIPLSIRGASFDDDYTPGQTFPDGVTQATDSRFVAIGGGRSNLVNGTGANGNGTPPGTTVSVPVMYNLQPLLGFGNGASRDAGAGPAFTGFPIKMVTATGAVADGAAVEAGFVNRSGFAMVATQSVHGSSATASAAVA
jgi:hypothetical protein